MIIKEKDTTTKGNKLGAWGFGLMVVLLITVGVMGTLAYQKAINHVKAQGVQEYRLNECTEHTYEDKSAKWLECEEVKMENNQ